MSAISPDAAAAHEFLTELRTRITTQPLPYQFGVEARALESLWEMFGHARSAMKNHAGCELFAREVTHLLNVDVRPLTAKWHRAHAAGMLATGDGADEFRAELEQLQRRLRVCAASLHEMAYGHRASDELTPPAFDKNALAAIFKPLAFGTPAEPDTINAAINDAELRDVQKRREHYNIASTGHDGVGLALSGGGIRSATFALGVVQVLADRGLLREVDFLSTVSGGGYTGSFLTTRLGNKEEHADVGAPHGPDPAPIRYLRQHAQFLTAYSMKDRWSKVTATLAGMLLNWTIPLVFLLVAALGSSTWAGKFAPYWPKLAAATGVLTLIMLGVYGLSMRWSRTSTRLAGDGLGWSAAALGGVLIAWGVARGYGPFIELMDKLRNNGAGMGSIAGLMGFLSLAGPAVLRFVPWLRKPAIHALAVKAVMTLAAVMVPILGLVVFYILRWQIECHGSLWFIVAAGVLAVFAFLIVDINQTSLHRLYRDGLSRTFVEQADNAQVVVPLGGINPGGTAPYLLVNATLNLPSSSHPTLRDRRCDFFLFSKHWTGAPSCGYQATSAWRMGNEPVDLASAMAISGAAVSPYMGLGSMPTLTALLTFLNIRLSYWINKPQKSVTTGRPGFVCLLREMMAINMSENQPWLNLSDGGHIENMAVYELLRRRCKFIVCVDGEADPGFCFEGLMTLVRHAQIDFGIRIEPDLDEMRANPATGLSQAHAHLCPIHYPSLGTTGAESEPSGELGLLLYLKLSVTGNESELIKRYRLNHPLFPHQTTLDQFFDQEQFEAYRQLGVHVAEGLFARALMSPDGQPNSIPRWFRQLARNLLLPESAELQAEQESSDSVST